MGQVFVEPPEGERAPLRAAGAISGMAAREAALFGGNGPYHTFPAPATSSSGETSLATDP